MKPTFKAISAGAGFTGILGTAILYKEEVIDLLRIVVSILRKLIH